MRQVVTHFSAHFLSNSDSIFLISKRLAYLLGLFYAIKTCFLTHCLTMQCVIIAKKENLPDNWHTLCTEKDVWLV